MATQEENPELTASRQASLKETLRYVRQGLPSKVWLAEIKGGMVEVTCSSCFGTIIISHEEGRTVLATVYAMEAAMMTGAHIEAEFEK